MKVLDLFSGIGGFSIGLEKAGFETVAFCEIEPYCRGVLEHHWPDTPIYGDVKQLTGEQLKADGIVPDVIVGGYPCQPFSVAGRQRGEKDPRHLWPEVHRLIRELRPRWVICENVSGHIKLGLDEVLATLEAEGYTVWPFVIPACSVDAPHKRDRVWIVGNAQHDGSLAAPLRGEPEEASRGSSQGQEQTQQSARAGGRKDNGNVADTNNRQRDRENQEVFSGRHATADGSQDVAYTSSQRPQGSCAEPVYGVRHLSRQSEGSSTDFKDGWPVEPNVGRVANGVPARTHRIKALGNAVVPQIPEAIGRTIMRMEAEL